jgi:hypothetical protein
MLNAVNRKHIAHVSPIAEGLHEAVEVIPPEGFVFATVVVDGGGRVGVGALLRAAVGFKGGRAVGVGGECEQSLAQR